jgi:hypothetical protein
MGRGRWRPAALLAFAALAAGPAAADEALLQGGRRLPGTLRLAPDGRLRFAPRTGETLPASDLARVRLDGPPPPFRAGGGWRVHLRDGEQLTGQLLGLDGDKVCLRTAWADRLEVPRPAVAAVTALPGWRLVFADDFAAGLKTWAVGGKEPAAAGEPPAVVLDAAGQELACTLPTPLPAGRVGINFQERDSPAGARWELEAAFERGRAPAAVVRVTVVGAGDHYRVAVPGLEGEQQPVARTPGWHRLVVQFTAGSLRVTCDDAVLWYTLRGGPGGSLRRVRLSCRAEDGVATRGAVAWADFTAEEAVEEPPRPDGDAGQDEVWLSAGDQLFGRVVRADRRAVELRGRSGSRTLPWSRVRGCYLRQASSPAHTTEGAHVRLDLSSGLSPDPDRLRGVVVALDGHRLTLRHALLGELALDRAAVRQVWPLFFGRRIELDGGFHHLGEAGRLHPALDPPRAEGPAWRGTFTLPAVPAEARLTLGVVHLLGPADPGGAALADGGLRTEVVVNGRRVDYLNRQVDRASREPRRLTVPLPADALRAGENVIELRQTPGPPAGRPAHCGISGISLEIPSSPPERSVP